jgi:hypothetical protein
VNGWVFNLFYPHEQSLFPEQGVLKFTSYNYRKQNKGKTGKCRYFPDENDTHVLPHLLAFVNTQTAILGNKPLSLMQTATNRRACILAYDGDQRER